MVGRDGVITLLLACAIAALSGGLTLVAAGLRILVVARQASTDPAGEAQCIIVLGSRLADGRPGPAFQTRLDRARALAAARPHVPIIVLGGVTTPEGAAEGTVGVRHLAASGVEAGRLFAEIRSRHTLENLRAFRAGFVLDGGPHAGRPLLLVSSRTHLARACAMARGLGLAVLPCAAEPRLHGPAWRRLPPEAFLLHWYAVGRGFATLTRNRRMLGRIR